MEEREHLRYRVHWWKIKKNKSYWQVVIGIGPGTKRGEG